ncbi:Os05g0485150 [Oryza sativa Japonica Group]|uniref:Os05g0485150 protein n=1 Tax=Oryza sativa subsp. japonica TaxID=39947 RepID=A0A0P0WNP2_ORYSJ|nr:Os05g0485150 [Oryza sativa Japonica Group]
MDNSASVTEAFVDYSNKYSYDELSLFGSMNSVANMSYTSLMEQIISSQPTISDMQEQNSAHSTFVASPSAFQEDESNEEDAMDNWNLDIFNLLDGEKEPSSMDNHRCTSVQGTRDDDNNPNDNSETNQQELTEEDINIFVENEQEEATKGLTTTTQQARKGMEK